jgi:hypothetical protein
MSTSCTEKYRDLSISGLQNTKGSARRSIATIEYGVSLLGVTIAVSFGVYTRPVL